MCLVAGARARGGWRVVLDDARGAAGSLRASLGAGASRESADVVCCAFSSAKAAWRKKIKDASRVRQTSPRGAEDWLDALEISGWPTHYLAGLHAPRIHLLSDRLLRQYVREQRQRREGLVRRRRRLGTRVEPLDDSAALCGENKVDKERASGQGHRATYRTCARPPQLQGLSLIPT